MSSPFSQSTRQLDFETSPSDARTKTATVPLMGQYEVNDLLGEYDTVACQNLELFESLASDVNITTASIFPRETRLGLRCIHCAKDSQAAPNDPITFPSSIGCLADCIRVAASNHLSHCVLVPPEVREITKRGPEKTQQNLNSHKGMRPQSPLQTYCVQVCQMHGISDISRFKTGITFSEALDNESTGETWTGNFGDGSRISPRPSPAEQDLYAPIPLTEKRDMSQESSEPHYNISLGHATKNNCTTDMLLQENQESDFPYFQDSNGCWCCKYCSHVPPHARYPQSIWSTPGREVPPTYFTDQHLASCQFYQQIISRYNLPQYHMSSNQFQRVRESSSTPTPVQSSHPIHYSRRLSSQSFPPYPHHLSSSVDGINNGYKTTTVQTTSLLSGNKQNISVIHAPEHPHEQYTHQRDGWALSPPFSPETEMMKSYSGPSSSQNHSRQSSTHKAIEYLTAMGKELRTQGERGSVSLRSAIECLSTADKELRTAGSTDHAADGLLVYEEDKRLLTDYVFYLMKQLRLCRFSEADRKSRGGKREKTKIGFGGLQCIHCAKEPNSRKFFWSDVDRLANSFAEIASHIYKCLCCPQKVKNALLELKRQHARQMAELPRGSQKIFFKKMWVRLHQGEKLAALPKASEDFASGDQPGKRSEERPERMPDTLMQNESQDEIDLTLHQQKKEAKVVRTESDAISPSSPILLAIPEDKEWLSDLNSFIRQQLEIFCATYEHTKTPSKQADGKNPILVHKGQIGIRCIYCASSKGGNRSHTSISEGIAFPDSIDTIYESVQELHQAHFNTCKNVPPDVKSKLMKLQEDPPFVRKYYVLAAKTLGLRDTPYGIRLGDKCSPIISKDAIGLVDAEKSDDVETLLASDGESVAGSYVESRKRKSKEERELSTSDAVGKKRLSGSWIKYIYTVLFPICRFATGMLSKTRAAEKGFVASSLVYCYRSLIHTSKLESIM